MAALRIGELLIQKKWISEKQLEEALWDQQTSGEMTGEILIRKGYLSRHLLYKALSEQARIEYIDLRKTRIDPAAVKKFPSRIAVEFNVMPLEIHADRMILAIPAPIHTWPEKEFLSTAGFKEVKKVLCLPDDIRSAVEEHYGHKK